MFELLTIKALWAKFMAYSFGWFFMWNLFPPALDNTPMQWFNLANMQLTTRELVRQMDVVLPDFSGPETVMRYPTIARQILTADEHTLIRVEVKNNSGGLDEVEELMHIALVNTQATVWMTITKKAASNGAFVLNASDYIFMPNDSILMFHKGAIVFSDDEGNIRQIVRITPDNPVTKAASTDREQQLDRYRPWLSQEEQQLFQTGGDVYLTGYSICNHGDERTVEILWKYKDGCVLKGMKYTPPSILEKLAIMKVAGY